MLDFIWHLRGSVPLDATISNEVALDRVEALLEKERKRDRERGPTSISFDDPLWSDPFGPNWLAMVTYDHGRFWVEQSLSGRRLRYDLRCLHGLVFCLIGAFAAFLFGLDDGGLVDGLKFAAAAFAWLYGMNVLLALTRVPRAIRSAVRAAHP